MGPSHGGFNASSRRWLLFSSNENWVVPAGTDERRFAVFDVADQWKEDHQRFADLYAELANGGREALLADLLSVALDAPEAPNLRVIPKTKALLEQKVRSLDPITAWWLGRLIDGSQTHRAAGWRHKVSNQTLFNDYLRTVEKAWRAPPRGRNRVRHTASPPGAQRRERALDGRRRSL